MAIQFVVEDGTSKSDATSYATVAEYKQWLENRGEATTDSDATIQARLNVAAEYVDSFNYIGTKTDIDQALEFPRIGLVIYDKDEIPREVKNAVFYAAQNYDDLFTVDSGIRSVSYGPVSKTYAGGASSKFDYITKSLKKFMITGVPLLRVN